MNWIIKKDEDNLGIFFLFKEGKGINKIKINENIIIFYMLSLMSNVLNLDCLKLERSC